MAKNKEKDKNKDDIRHDDGMNKDNGVNVESAESEQQVRDEQSPGKKTAGEKESEIGEEKNAVQAEKEEEIERLKTELSEAKDKYLRLYSEFENYRRRTAKERLELVSSANEELVSELLPVLDDFDRAKQNYSEDTDVKSLKEGMDLIAHKFGKVLEQKGVKEMEGKEGIEFDPDLHEAITKIPAPKEELKGKVVDVIEKGYYLKDKVIRFAKVVIGS